MRAYFSLLRIRFINGLQYRAAALAGISTQFAWGFMEILAFSAFYRANPDAFPMEFSQLVQYIWLQQAFLGVIVPWSWGGNITETIVNGNIAYELVRPMNLYNRWYFESLANRLANAAMRCLPILAVAFLLPAPFRMNLPANLGGLGLFAVSLTLTVLVVSAYVILDYISVFYTMSRYNAIFSVAADFLAGGYIPLSFFPATLRRILELSPFGAMQNLPLRIFNGEIAGSDAMWGIALQVFWLIVMVLLGKLLMKHSLKRVVAQGG
ncbi:MAG: ABC-2 family transporter protein [Oscillospiraceae bacterium]|nr:ABC-2 family transporter protein [Oscillospiraceae bacterium]